jgi:amino acid transporter
MGYLSFVMLFSVVGAFAMLRVSYDLLYLNGAHQFDTAYSHYILATISFVMNLVAFSICPTFLDFYVKNTSDLDSEDESDDASIAFQVIMITFVGVGEAQVFFNIVISSIMIQANYPAPNGESLFHQSLYISLSMSLMMLLIQFRLMFEYINDESDDDSCCCSC